MPKVPKKNIFHNLRDVRPPGVLKEELTKESAPTEIYLSTLPPLPPDKAQKYMRFALVGVVSLAIFAGGFYGFAKVKDFSWTKEPAANAEPIMDIAQNDAVRGLSKIINAALPLLKNGTQNYSSLKTFAESAASIANVYENLKKLAQFAIRGERGEEVVAQIASAELNLEILSTELVKLQRNESAKAILPFLAGKNFLASLELVRWTEIAATLAEFAEGDRRIIVFFENPEELRPAGGFWGSFADVRLSRGAVKELKVYGSEEIKTNLEVSPPKPLLQLSSKWRVQDANWFFNFPDSAVQAADFISNSNLPGQVDAVFSFTPRALADILKVTGPIYLPEHKIILQADTAFVEMEKYILNARAKKNANPKSIIKEFAPLLIKAIGDLPSARLSEIYGLFGGWFANRDLTIYFKNAKLQSFFERYGWAGETYSAPRDYVGDYLAVVNANMGSGKTDTAIRQTVELKSVLGVDGNVSNKVAIKRRHTGNVSSYFWHKVANENYIKVITPPRSELTSFAGGSAKTTGESKLLSVKDTLIAEMEMSEKTYFDFPNVRSFVESGKKSFAFWSRIALGETRKINLEYEHKLFVPPADGGAYEFILERQAGSQTEYSLEFQSPVGFVWAENGLPIYETEIKDPPGRIRLELTFQKNE